MAFNWQQALAGAAGGGLGGAGTGATLGATIGSAGGPIGSLGGAGLGALLGLLGGGIAGGFGGGSEGGLEQAANFGPEELKILSMLLQQGGQNLQNPYQGFEPISDVARSQFNTQTIPGIAERFTSLGSGAQRSSAFQGALGSAASGLEQNLAALRSQYGMQNRESALRQLQLGLTPRFQTFYKQSQPGFGENLLTSTLQAAPSAIQGYYQNQALQKLLAK